MFSFGQTNDNSIQFDGNSSYLDCGNPLELKIANEITYMAWVKSTQWTNVSGIVGRGEGTSDATRSASFLMILPSTPGQIRWEISDGNLKDNLFSNTNLSLDTWNHIAVTWDGTNSATSMKIYIDGVLDVSGASTISSINQNISALEDNKFKIGLRDVISAGQLYGHHNGFIDEVSAWNIALSESEIQQYMDCPPTGSEQNLAGYWNFEDGTGTVASDLTTNGNDANFVNSPLWNTDVVPYNCDNLNIDKLNRHNLVTVFPIPFDNDFNIKISPLLIGKSYRLFDLKGKLIKSGTLDKETNKIHLNDIPKGAFYLSIDNLNKPLKVIH